MTISRWGSAFLIHKWTRHRRQKACAGRRRTGFRPFEEKTGLFQALNTAQRLVKNAQAAPVFYDHFVSFTPALSAMGGQAARRCRPIPSFCGQVCASTQGQAGKALSGAACSAVPVKQAAPARRSLRSLRAALV
jgi:hypothetical protein